LARGAVTEQQYGHTRFSRFREPYDARNIVDIVRDVIDAETLALQLPPVAQIQRVYSETAGHKLLCHPLILATVGIDAVTNDDHAARRSRPP
jgi:hypothetical protein